MVDALNVDSIQVMQAVPWGIIIPALVSAMGLFKGGGSSGGAGGASAESMMSPEMKEMFNIHLARMKRQEPLYQDVMGMARGLLPTRYRTGMPYRPGDGGGSGAVDTGAGTGQGPNNPHGPDFNPTDPGSNPNPPPPRY